LIILIVYFIRKMQL